MRSVARIITAIVVVLLFLIMQSQLALVNAMFSTELSQSQYQFILYFLFATMLMGAISGTVCRRLLVGWVPFIVVLGIIAIYLIAEVCTGFGCFAILVPIVVVPVLVLPPVLGCQIGSIIARIVDMILSEEANRGREKRDNIMTLYIIYR